MYRRINGDWKITEHHSSAMPEPVVNPLDEVADQFDRWNSALQTGDPETVASLYADDGVLLPTVSNKVRTDHAGKVRAERTAQNSGAQPGSSSGDGSSGGSGTVFAPALAACTCTLPTILCHWYPVHVPPPRLPADCVCVCLLPPFLHRWTTSPTS